MAPRKDTMTSPLRMRSVSRSSGVKLYVATMVVVLTMLSSLHCVVDATGLRMKEPVYIEQINADALPLGADQGVFSSESLSWWEWVKRLVHWHSRDESVEATDDELEQDPPVTKYSQATAVYLAYVTSVAYCQAHHIRNWSCSPCALIEPLRNITVVEDEKDNFQGIVGYNHDRNVVIVAFRGSMDISNWIDNLTFIKRRAYAEYPEVKVHEGFYWVYKSVEDQVVAAVQKLTKGYPTAKVVVTGHSLGGAVAALCTFDLAVLHHIPVHEIYTFGEPRVGNANFSDLLNKAVPEVYRVTHFRDVVPHLPPTWVGFHHTAQEIFYDEYASTYIVCDPVDGEDPRCSDACSPFGCTSVVDHLNYLNVTMSHLIC